MLATALRLGSARSEKAARYCEGLLQGMAMNETWIGIALGGSVLLIALLSVVQHYRRERLRAELLKNLDHNSWCRFSRARR